MTAMKSFSSFAILFGMLLLGTSLHLACWGDEVIHTLSTQMDQASEEARFQQRASDDILSAMESALIHARELSPDDAETIYMERLFAKALGKYDAAEAAWLQALAEVPNYPRAYQALIELYIETGRLNSAQRLMQPLLDLKGETEDYQYLAARLLYREGDMANALTFFKKLENSPNPSAHLMAKRATYLSEMADTLKHLGMSQDALTTYNQAIAIKTPTYSTWIDYADLLNETAQSEQAIEAYRKAFIQNPRTLDKLLSRANASFWEKSPSAGLHDYAIAYKIAPTRSDVLYLVCDILYYLWKSGMEIPKSELVLAKQFVDLQTQGGYNGADAMKIANIELHAIQNNGLSSEDRNTLQAIGNRKTLSLTSAKAWLLLEAPSEAKTALENLPEKDRNAKNTIVSLLALNAWPYAQAFAEDSEIQKNVTIWANRELTTANQLLNQAEGTLQAGQAQEAITQFGQALQHDLFLADGYYGIARGYLAQKQVPQAQAAYNLALNLGFIPRKDPVTEKILMQLDPNFKPEPKARRNNRAQKS